MRHMGPMRGSRRFLSEEEKSQRPKVSVPLIKRILSYLRPYWRQEILILFTIFSGTVLRLMPAILTGRMIDEGLIGRDLPLLVKLIGMSVGVIILANLIGLLENYLNTWIAQNITYDMRNAMFAHLQSMSHHFFTVNSQGDLITRMTSDISGVQQIIAGTFTGTLSNVITLIVATFAMYRKNAVLATIGLIIVPIFALQTRRAGKTRWLLTREAQECHDEMNTILHETLSVSGQLLVKLFHRQDYEYNRYKTANHQMMKLNIQESLAGRWFRVVINTFSNIGPLLLYLVGGILMIRYESTLTVGDITVLVALLGRMYGPFNSLLSTQVDWIRSMALFTRIFEYYDMPAEIVNAPDSLYPEKMIGNVTFEHVNFSYEPEREILRDVHFSLTTGKSLAIVGPSGSGKSTIINLLLRLYDVDEGRVMIDGVDIRKLKLEYLRKNIGVVTQDTYLFNGTIKENLLYAKPDATDEELIHVCKKANIHDFIEAQPLKYNSLVGNRGLKLSGGEKQRISIARVLLKEPTIVIFDEATSSLDSISESLIQESIEPMIAERTSMIIAHRLSTVLSADEILVLKDGRIFEQGTHDELLKKNSLYSELYETQFI